MWASRCIIAAVLLGAAVAAQEIEPRLSDERVVFQTNWGEFHFGFFPEASASRLGPVLVAGQGAGARPARGA